MKFINAIVIDSQEESIHFFQKVFNDNKISNHIEYSIDFEKIKELIENNNINYIILGDILGFDYDKLVNCVKSSEKNIIIAYFGNLESIYNKLLENYSNIKRIKKTTNHCEFEINRLLNEQTRLD